MEIVAENNPTRIQYPTLKSQTQISPLLPHQYPTHLDEPEISPSAKLFCEILTQTRSGDVEATLSNSGLLPTIDLVQEVLRYSYNNPSGAVDFFRWAGRSHRHTALAWNLMVDILGRNRLFEPMWDAIRSMKQEDAVSTATFVSVFGSYCSVGRSNEATMSFDVMGKYGVEPDIFAVNALLSAICGKENQMGNASGFFERVKGRIPPNGDTFAILLEGWEKEGNVAEAKTTFGEMVMRIGWSPQNVAAYDAFLTTLVRGSKAGEAVNFLNVMKGKNCLPGLKFFSNAFNVLVKNNDSAHAVPMWDIMVGSGLMPNLIMYNAMIGLLCENNDVDNAFRLLDEMVFHGAFPDFLTYNMIFRCLVKNNRVCLTGKFFHEMIKNECPPNHLDCTAAITMLIGGDDPEMAIEIWDYMVEDCVLPLDESANALLLGLCNLNRLLEVQRFADDMLNRRIIIRKSTMEKLKDAFYRENRSKRDKYDSLFRRWKAS